MLEKIHDGLFEILCYFDELCNELDLKYYLAYGTLLGGVRHKDFIPWDDDADIWMPRKDFMKLIEYLRHQNPGSRFVIGEGEYKINGEKPSEFQIKIFDTQNQINKDFAGEITQSYLWIDIFALDSFPDVKKKQFINKFKRNLFMYKVARSKTFIVDNGSFLSVMNKLIYFLHNKCHLLNNVLDVNDYVRKTVSHISKYMDKEGSEYSEYFCYASVYLPQLEKCLFKKEWFDERVTVELRGRTFSAPKNYDKVLKQIYNDYMKIPEEHERVCHGAEII